MDGKFYGSEDFNPRLITTQIVVMQSLFYTTFVAITAAVDWCAGFTQSLTQFFQPDEYTWETQEGFALLVCLWLTSLLMAVSLRFVVERAKKCLDFVATYHFFHLVFTCCNSDFPKTFHWWCTNGFALIIATVLGEYLCMQAETKAIKLVSKPTKVAKPAAGDDL
mmetsp:Transcript_20601/g.46263  ORF Transcript_20601/g.46263 Transcript_20601/m.46263 type:complete len:165 (+) Transcript_20601:162-656(+)